jgi:lantibiotic modifying enzyme
MTRTRRRGIHASDGRESPYLDAARAIAEQFVRTAIPAASGVTWDGDDLAGEDEASIAVVRGRVGPGLYSGTAGIGWFLAHAARATGETAPADTAVRAVRYALEAVTSSGAPTDLSLMTGGSGIALAAVEVSAVLRRPDLRRRGTTLARQVADAVRDSAATIRSWDLIGGLAGVIAGLLGVHRRAPDPRLLEGCRAAARALLRARRASGFGTSWVEDATAEQVLPGSGPAAPRPRGGGGECATGLCGLGHGASGIAWALAELAWITGRRDLAPVVRDALRYERGWFSPERCAWADLREAAVASGPAEWPAWTTAWCHGAIGIGAMRWRQYERTRDVGALAEASAAIHGARRLVSTAGAALRRGHVSDVTVCHGLGGAVDLMLLAWEATGQTEHLRAARRAGDLCLGIFRANGNRWTTGLRGAEDVPGLFVGRAGIGTVMLRLHDPALAASPLLPGRGQKLFQEPRVAQRRASA